MRASSGGVTGCLMGELCCFGHYVLIEDFLHAGYMNSMNFHFMYWIHSRFVALVQTVASLPLIIL